MIFCLGKTSFVSYAEEMDETIASMQQEEAQTQETISNLEKQTKETKEAISALQGQRTQTQNALSNLQSQSSELQKTINGYSNKLDDLNEEISEAEKAMAEVSSEIVRLDNELQEARQKEKERHDLLMLRMKNTYESGGSKGIVRIIIESGSMQEFLTKFEYFSAILRYDTKVITEYKALQDLIEQKVEVVEEKEAQLDEYQNVLDAKHNELADLTDEVKGKLSSTNSSISSEKNKLADYDNQLADLDKKMKALEAQTAEAQAKLAQQIANRLALTKEDTSGAYAASASELEWLAATIQAEAGGESYTGKLAVGSVIMNRVKSSAFPNTIVGVITQNMQFASYRSGKVELIIANGPNSTCIQAAQEVLDGARVGDYLFFMTQYYADYYGISEYTMIGNHAFFYRWITNKKEPEQTSTESQESEAPQEAQPEPSSEETPQENYSEETPSENQEPSEENNENQENPEPQENAEPQDSSSQEDGNSEGGSE
ncbi:Cell Wall Hydrolase [Butyrivibrio sp. YAB3001]|nr:Cell Wall Hydrolase [Butyrivibrio sp. YAB3001]